MKKIKHILFSRHSAPFYLIIILFLIVVFSLDNEYIMRIKKLTNQNDGFNIMTQFFIPGFSGIAGGYSTVVISSFKDKYIQHNNVYSKFMSIGFIAGVAAVNLLNPSGTVSQVMILGLLAGLSGFSYLERSALVQAESEREALVENNKEEFIEKHNKPVVKDFNSTNEEQLLAELEKQAFEELERLTTQKRKRGDS